MATYCFVFACAVLTQLYCCQGIRLGYTQNLVLSDKQYDYKTTTLQVPIDHFSFADSKTFPLRILYNDTWWDKHRGPIFFYTGNEGDIELFAQNTGFMWDIAPSFRALLVFAEHRYYGKSLPFGNHSYSDPKYLGYLTSQQALADFVDVIDHFQEFRKSETKAPVVAFGGSYGGMLSAWLRMKYPASVAGAIAASAPILQFKNMTPCDAFSKVTTSVYEKAEKGCADFIRRSWGIIRNVTSKADGLDWLSTAFKLCKKLGANQIDGFFANLQDIYTNLAMINYPYPSNFLSKVPANPVKVVCNRMLSPHIDTKSGEADGVPLPKEADALRRLFRGINVYFNYTGDQKCFNWNETGTESLGTDGWAFQSCSELPMPMCMDGKTDMFYPAPWDEQSYTKECKKSFKVEPQYDLPRKEYGGQELAAASNIIFRFDIDGELSHYYVFLFGTTMVRLGILFLKGEGKHHLEGKHNNGLLDPWSSGGVLFNVSATALAVLIPEGAHHLDLRSANPADPSSVRLARGFHKRAIKQWIREHWKEQHQRRAF